MYIKERSQLKIVHKQMSKILDDVPILADSWNQNQFYKDHLIQL
jgi:hypothetical protein